MRFEGTLKTWNDERGFGFIEPAAGGEDIFVHIKAFGPRSGRPQEQQLVSFEVELGPQGKKRAKNVQPVRRIAPRRKAMNDSPAQWGGATLFAIPAFALLFLGVSILWKPPLVVAMVYLEASVAAFAAYAIDKAAARRGSSRTPELALHLLALIGGWPGALLAQQFLRHKSTKRKFREVFWVTVVINVAVFMTLSLADG